MNITARLQAVEKRIAAGGSKFARANFAMRYIETSPDVDITPELAEVDAAALAAGWQPGDGLYCIIVEMAGDEGRTPQIRWVEPVPGGRQEFVKVRGQDSILGKFCANIPI